MTNLTTLTATLERLPCTFESWDVILAFTYHLSHWPTSDTLETALVIPKIYILLTSLVRNSTS